MNQQDLEKTIRQIRLFINPKKPPQHFPDVTFIDPACLNFVIELRRQMIVRSYPRLPNLSKYLDSIDIAIRTGHNSPNLPGSAIPPLIYPDQLIAHIIGQELLKIRKLYN